MKSVAFHNLGCKVNAYEVDIMQQKFTENGFRVVPFSQKADIYVVNTCTVTNMADRKSRQMLHKAKSENPEAIVIAVGCYVQTSTEAVLKDLSIDIAIGNNRKASIIEDLNKYLEEHPEKKARLEKKEDQLDDDFISISQSGATCADTTSTVPSISDDTDANHAYADVIDINHTYEYEDMMLSETLDRTRAYIKIQDGCNQFCSYCLIPYARGRVRSRNMDEIVDEVKGLTERGYNEFVLTGIHISSYGIVDPNDLSQNKLATLIEKIAEIENVKRIRLGSLEPRVVTDEFAKRISSLSKVCPHFHLSLQSGCDNTLKRMNRHYTAAQFMEGVNTLRKYFDNPAITTDIIVGFPGETEEDFEVSYQFAKEVGFYEMHIFKYSKRKGTVAEKLPNQVPDQIKEERSNKMLELEAVLSKGYRESKLGKARDVLFEETKVINGIKYQIGHTPEYVKVAVISEKNLDNQIISVTPMSFINDEIVTDV